MLDVMVPMHAGGESREARQQLRPGWDTRAPASLPAQGSPSIAAGVRDPSVVGKTALHPLSLSPLSIYFSERERVSE